MKGGKSHTRTPSLKQKTKDRCRIEVSPPPPVAVGRTPDGGPGDVDTHPRVSPVPNFRGASKTVHGQNNTSHPHRVPTLVVPRPVGEGAGRDGTPESSRSLPRGLDESPRETSPKGPPLSSTRPYSCPSPLEALPLPSPSDPRFPGAEGCEPLPEGTWIDASGRRFRSVALFRKPSSGTPRVKGFSLESRAPGVAGVAVVVLFTLGQRWRRDVPTRVGWGIRGRVGAGSGPAGVSPGDIAAETRGGAAVGEGPRDTTPSGAARGPGADRGRPPDSVRRASDGRRPTRDADGGGGGGGVGGGGPRGPEAARPGRGGPPAPLRRRTSGARAAHAGDQGPRRALAAARRKGVLYVARAARLTVLKPTAPAQCTGSRVQGRCRTDGLGHRKGGLGERRPLPKDEKDQPEERPDPQGGSVLAHTRAGVRPGSGVTSRTVRGPRAPSLRAIVSSVLTYFG